MNAPSSRVLFSFFYFYLFIFFVFCLFRATSMAYGGSQVRDPIQLKLKLLAYTTATATRDPSHICDLHHSSQQRRILNPLSKARDQNCVLMDANQIHFHWATTELWYTGTFFLKLFFIFIFCLFAFSRAAPAAYGGSQARGRIRSCSHLPIPQPQQRWIRAASATYTTAHSNAGSFNLLSKARDRTHNLMVPSRIS